MPSLHLFLISLFSFPHFFIFSSWTSQTSHTLISHSPPEQVYKGFLLFEHPGWCLSQHPGRLAQWQSQGSHAGRLVPEPKLSPLCYGGCWWHSILFRHTQSSPLLHFLFSYFLHLYFFFVLFCFHLFPLIFLTCWLGSKILKTKTSKNKC